MSQELDRVPDQYRFNAKRAQSRSVRFNVSGNVVNAVYCGGADVCCCCIICFRCSNMRCMLPIIC